MISIENESETEERFKIPLHSPSNDTLVKKKKEESNEEEKEEENEEYEENKKEEKKKEEKKEDQYFLCQKLDEAVHDAPPNVEFQKEVHKSKEEKKKVFLFNMSNDQKKQAEQLKIDKIIENEIYLKKNKVLRYIIQMFLSDLLKEKPEDVYSFAASYFTRSNLKQYISEKLKETLKK